MPEDERGRTASAGRGVTGRPCPEAGYFADDAVVDRESLSRELAELLEQAERFEARPRRPPIEEPEPICWRAPDDWSAAP